MIIEDDASDADAIHAAIQSLGIKNELKIMTATEGYDYLMTTGDKPMLILCDIRMPGLDGLTLLKKIRQNEYLCNKAIPFIFYTCLDLQQIINEAFRIGIQGFYIKAAHFEEIKKQLYAILLYWNSSRHPVPERDAGAAIRQEA